MESSTSGDLIVAADFGTSGVKVGLVDPQFTIVARTLVNYPLALPEPGHAEQDPRDWWQGLCAALARLGEEVPRLPERVAGMVFCAQMCGVVCADPDGEPLRLALIWLDKRSAALTRRLVGGFPSISGYQVGKLWRWIRYANGAPSLNGMDATGKMLWLKLNEPEVFARSAKLLDVKDWLIHRATGEFSTTADSANLSWVMDTRRGREGWSHVLAEAVGIPMEKLPRIVDGAEEAGRLTAQAARELGLRAGLPVMGGGGDVTATALGSGAVGDGELHICASTSSWIGGFFPSRRLNVGCSYATITSSLSYRPLLVATQETAGSAFAWISQLVGDPPCTDNGGLARLYSDVGDPQPSDPFFLPWLSGERVPVDDDRLRGAFYGLSLRHDDKAMLRAVIEGVAMNTRWMYDRVVRERGVRKDGPLPLVGGVAFNPFFAQTLANCLGRTIVSGEPQYTGVLGAAAIAAAGLGWRDSVWSGAAAIGSRMNVAFQPQEERASELAARYRRLCRVRKAMVRLNRRDAPIEEVGG